MYLGQWGASGALGCMHSSWNDVTGSFLMRRERPFLQNVRENDWGDVFCDFHAARSQGDAPVVGVSGGSWVLRVEVRGRGAVVTLHVEGQSRGAFVGYAFGAWPMRDGRAAEKVWLLRGCQQEKSVALLLEEEDEAGGEGTVCLMLLGTMDEALVMRGRMVADESAAHLETGSFVAGPSKWTEKKK